MRISDWSSDVCSSDLAAQNRGELLYKNICAWVTDNFVNPEMTSELVADHFHISSRYIQNLFAKYGGGTTFVSFLREKRLRHAWGMLVSAIGRASCRDRVCQYV